MREIKFRAWDKKEKKWLIPKGNSICFPFAVSPSKPWDKRLALFGFQSSDKIEWMQYTGLEDKKGKEIYEGDVVKTNNKESPSGLPLAQFKGDIKFKEGCFVVDEGTEYNTTLRNWLSKNIVEVLGNIYENKELLK